MANSAAKTDAAHPISPVSGKPGSWLYNPVLDLVVGCGAWSAPLLLITYLVTKSSVSALAITFYALALVLNYPHYMATIYRAFGSREDFVKYRLFTVHLTALLLLTVVVAHLQYQLLPWIFTLYVVWSPWHYSGQNYGLLMMFARRNGASPTVRERRALYGAFLISYVMLMVSFNVSASADPLVLSLGLSEGSGFVSRILCGILFAGLGGFAFFNLIRKLGLRAMLAPLTLFATQFLWFVLPTILDLGYGLRLPQTRYSTGILALMHSAQYLWVTSYYAKRESGKTWSQWGYFAILIAGGIALFVPGPWLVSYIFHYDFSASFLIFTALVNIHHFMMDGAIWKLRDGRIAALLLNARERAGKELAAPIFPWLTQPTRAGRISRASIFAGLLLWAGVDEFHYYLGASDNQISKLTAAAKLNPFDGAVQMRIARAEAGSGNSEATLAALQKAVAVNPSNPAPHLELARAQLMYGHYSEAYANYQPLITKSNDPETLLNFGVLAAQMGHTDEAITSWNRAAVADPQMAAPQLYLAEAFRKQSNNAAAGTHFESYLRLVAVHPESRPPAREMIIVMLHYAGSSARLGRTATSVQAYTFAAGMAEHEHQTDLESLSLAALAELHATLGNTAEALQTYQRVISLDTAAGQLQNQAMDWFNYGQFLWEKNSLRLGYACLLKADSVLRGPSSGAQSSTLGTIAERRKHMEAELGSAAADVRRAFPAALAKAASLQAKGLE